MKKTITIKMGNIKEPNGKGRFTVTPTFSGFSTFLTIQNRLQKGWKNIPKHNQEWDELMKYNFIPFLYFIDKSQFIQKHFKEIYESEGYEVEYDENEINEDVEQCWKLWFEKYIDETLQSTPK